MQPIIDHVNIQVREKTGNILNGIAEYRTVRRLVRVTVDLEAIAKSLGPKAWANSSGKSKLAVGVTVERA